MPASTRRFLPFLLASVLRFARAALAAAPQAESDGILEDLEVALDSPREELHVFAKKRGTMVGNITIIDNGDEIGCRRMGSGGYAIPSICEPKVVQTGQVRGGLRAARREGHRVEPVQRGPLLGDARLHPHRRLGQPPWGVRRLLARLHAELGLPRQREIEKLLAGGFKMEVEALITKDISYVTDVYVPERLEAGEFLD